MGFQAAAAAAAAPVMASPGSAVGLVPSGQPSAPFMAAGNGQSVGFASGRNGQLGALAPAGINIQPGPFGPGINSQLDSYNNNMNNNNYNNNNNNPRLHNFQASFFFEFV